MNVGKNKKGVDIMQKIRKGSVVEYDANTGAFGIVQNIGKKRITIRKAIGSPDNLKTVTKLYYEPKDKPLHVLKY